MRGVLLFLSGFLFLTANAQQFGGHPLSQRWLQIKTPRTQVIFPVGWDSTARRVASILNKIDGVASFPLTSPVPVILQHHTTQSNGYVALAPLRSEWYMTAPVNGFELGSINWPEQLALHEQRHFQQYQRFNRGGAKVFRFLLGQQGQALANALTVPDWFFEGDAVFQETLLSEQGRGRMPSFFNAWNALQEAGKNYSYQKLRNGSLRDFTPSHYQLGYLLLQYGQQQYGLSFWNKVTTDAAAMKGGFYPFQKAVNEYSGITFKEFRKKALDVNQDTGKFQPVINEENPLYTETGDLLYLRSSYAELPAFYLRLKTGEEKKIRVRDQSLDSYFSYANGKILYAAYQPDTRWGWRDYSDLKILDIATGKQDRITSRTTYFTPALSSTGDSIIAVLQDASGKSALHLLTADGKLLKEFPNDSGYIYSFPRFAKNTLLTASRSRKGEMTLHAIDLVTSEHKALFNWSNHIIGYPMPVGDSVFFTMSVNNRDQTLLFFNNQLTLLDTGNQLTGTYQPAVMDQQLTNMQFTAHGYKLVTRSISVQKLLPVDQILTLPMILQEGEQYKTAPASFLHYDTDTTLKIKQYKNTSGFLNVHSWTPWYEEPEFSLTAHSQNLLNNFQTNLSATYNRNEDFTKLGFQSVFGGLFPFVRAGFDYTFNRQAVFRNRNIRWNELELSTGLQLPLNLSSGRQFSSLTLSSDFIFNQPWFRLPEKDSLGNRSYAYLNNQLVFAIQTQQVRQQIFPKWAGTIRFQYRNAINRYSSRQWLAAGNQYFPGFVRNHSLVLGWAVGGRDSLPGIRFSNNFPFARGYETLNLFRMQRTGISYHFPIAYPDAGLAQIVYLLRVRAAAYFDYARAKDPQLFRQSGWINFRSTGLECYFDTRWWNQLPVSFGIRYAYLLDPDRMGSIGSNRWQFILPVNLIPSGAAKSDREKRKQFSVF
ncbi:MAG: hypothetical protein JNK20_14100 [Flavipsychrobacter sp.]|nr:hypothetical protein [Flavipsychrobacter sp.]